MPEDDQQKPKHYHPETRLIHGLFLSPHWDYSDHIVPPICSSVAYRLESGRAGRRGIPEVRQSRVVARRQPDLHLRPARRADPRPCSRRTLAPAEGGARAVAFATGMAAICGGARRPAPRRRHAGLPPHHLRLHLLAARRTGCRASRHQGRFVDLRDAAALRAALTDDVMAVYFETPCNPTLDILDCAPSSDLGRRVNARRRTAAADLHRGRQHLRHPVLPAAARARYRPGRRTRSPRTSAASAPTWAAWWWGRSCSSPTCCSTARTSARRSRPRSPGPRWSTVCRPCRLRMRRQRRRRWRWRASSSRTPAVARVVLPRPRELPAARSRPEADARLRRPVRAGHPDLLRLRRTGAEAHERGRRFMDHLAQKALTITLAVCLGQVRTLIEHPASMTHAADPARGAGGGRHRSGRRADVPRAGAARGPDPGPDGRARLPEIVSRPHIRTA